MKPLRDAGASLRFLFFSLLSAADVRHGREGGPHAQSVPSLLMLDAPA
jgi:hypothetical protein